MFTWRCLECRVRPFMVLPSLSYGAFLTAARECSDVVLAVRLENDRSPGIDAGC